MNFAQLRARRGLCMQNVPPRLARDCDFAIGEFKALWVTRLSDDAWSLGWAELLDPR